jgi:hypothetical protein
MPMAAKPVCLVCKKEMELGFMTDAAAGIHVPLWCAGEPNWNIWTGSGAGKAQHESGLKVVAYRCPECEALRLYAPSNPS